MTTATTPLPAVTNDEVSAFLHGTASAVVYLAHAEHDGELVDLRDLCDDLSLDIDAVVTRTMPLVNPDCVTFMRDNLADLRTFGNFFESGHDFACARLGYWDPMPVGDGLDDVRERLDANAQEYSDQWVDFWLEDGDTPHVAMEVLGMPYVPRPDVLPVALVQEVLNGLSDPSPYSWGDPIFVEVEAYVTAQWERVALLMESGFSAFEAGTQLREAFVEWRKVRLL